MIANTSFDDALLRLKQALRVKNDTDVADKLGLHQSTLAHKKRKNEFPEKQLKEFIDLNPEYEIDYEYIMTGVYSEFAQIKNRLKEELHLKTDMEVFLRLGISSNEFLKAKSENKFPVKAILDYASKVGGSGFDVDYVLTGKRIKNAEYPPHLVEALDHLSDFSPQQQMLVLGLINEIHTLNLKGKLTE